MLSIGKGPYEKGAVWVATRIPDGMVCAHANQARTRTFPRGISRQFTKMEKISPPYLTVNERE